ncbi:Xaa-Pro aminopeptidase [Posidoniimonas corsicana]|uniref:Xaa-Pro aminopeptidase n=1 Tax=Posidoniimonas corsicana TaxID=1938618 RepID=A0A5C5VDU3_9BACT|nr:aminopeptidase P N-terminal domain-containing protein [Posidoniimonas corsicana]TWT35892.1 Xaa-Pro aminopeptidase [Posidoniimonas corsicana]
MPDLHYQDAFPPSEFARRRSALAAAIGEGVAVLQGAPSTGAFDLFRQYNDFYYLTGAECPHAYLTIDGRTGRSVLYLLPTDERLAELEGAELSVTFPDETLRLTGCDDVKPLEALAGDLRSAKQVYAPHLPQEGLQACQDTLRVQAKMAAQDPWRAAAESFANRIASLCPEAEVRDLSPTLGAMRRIKSATEIDQMRFTGRLTAMAVSEAMRCTTPGLLEGQLRAVAEYVYLLNGATGGGYRPIIAGGDNIWNIHYYRNNCRLQAGDLVLMDYAPDAANYTSDIGRMWPVSGRYEPWQRELYGFVVDYQQLLLDLVRPGMTWDNLRQEVEAKMAPTLSRVRWSRPSFETGVRQLLTTCNPLTHEVGMAVHDSSGYQTEPLEPGVVFALDPQLWVREEKLYIRVEDTVVVTDSGIENLTPQCPHDLDAVTELMKEPGLMQLRPDLFAD